MAYPKERPRRLRRNQNLRALCCETRLCIDNLILPLFVVSGSGIKEEISSMPQNYHFSADLLLEHCRLASQAGIKAILLFGIPEHKDEQASSSWDEKGPVSTALRLLKKELPELILITDVCLCAYTNHGHCGLLKQGTILNDESNEILCRMALAHAKNGADIVAPSDMFDGRIGAIRSALDGEDFTDTAIMSYAVKYASSYYGPFRDAAKSTPTSGDRRSHQMDPGNIREALREVRLDVEEGADMVMVKPALAYLDVIRAVRETVELPVVAYNVSGEFSMVKAAAEKGWIEEKAVVLETLTSMRRAGADLLITYSALDAASWLKE